jgi:CheY-like chemotaxis protein
MAKKILVVDDDVLVLKTVKKLLEREEYAVDTAKSAKEAIEKLGGQEFNLIVCDVRMPDMDGIEFLEQIKKENKAKAPVIYITGYASEEAPIKALRLGAKDYVLKPFDMDKLLDSVKKNLG